VLSGALVETSPLLPSTFRGASKAAATLLCAQMASEAGIGAVHLRLFSVYGPLETPTRFVPTVLRALADGTSVTLTRPGIAHDFVFVADVVDACLRAARCDGAAGEIVNIGTGVRTTNEALVQLAERVTGRHARVAAGLYPRRAVDDALGVADITKARKLLGWEPAHNLEQGLAETWLRMIRAGTAPPAR